MGNFAVVTEAGAAGRSRKACEVSVFCNAMASLADSGMGICNVDSSTVPFRPLVHGV